MSGFSRLPMPSSKAVPTVSLKDDLGHHLDDDLRTDDGYEDVMEADDGPSRAVSTMVTRNRRKSQAATRVLKAKRKSMKALNSRVGAVRAAGRAHASPAYRRPTNASKQRSSGSAVANTSKNSDFTALSQSALVTGRQSVAVSRTAATMNFNPRRATVAPRAGSRGASAVALLAPQRQPMIAPAAAARTIREVNFEDEETTSSTSRKTPRRMAALNAMSKLNELSPASRRPRAAGGVRRPVASNDFADEGPSSRRARMESGGFDEGHDLIGCRGDGVDGALPAGYAPPTFAKYVNPDTKFRQTKQDADMLRRRCHTLWEAILDMRRNARAWMSEQEDYAQLQVDHEAMRKNLRQTQRTLEDSEDEKKRLERKVANLERSVADRDDSIVTLESTLSKVKTEVTRLTAELGASQALTNAAEERAKSLEKTNAAQAEAIVEKVAKIEELTNQAREHELIRRKLHNTVQELKGNIRVFCRVRPLLESETNGAQAMPLKHVAFPDVDAKKIVLWDDENANASTYSFEFDKVFKPEATQREVFDEISQLVQSALDGYNVSIFAYGQTGSGKTFTMEGPGAETIQDQPELAGMIPLAVEQVFATAEDEATHGWKYEMEASFLEIYNEQVRDLLNWSEEQRLDIRQGATSSSTDVAGLTVEKVTSRNQVYRLLKKASHFRAKAATKCNDRSSRSHSVFMLKISGQNTANGKKCDAVLNLVDLAGSERLKVSKAEGERLKETQHINKSLSILSTVIIALSNKENHVPYRNSRLTYLLQNSLGGNSKTLMFVNIAPRKDCLNESVSSLRFATTVNECVIGTASKKVGH